MVIHVRRRAKNEDAPMARLRRFRPCVSEVTGRFYDPLMVTRPPAGSIPDAPGVYMFRDAQGAVLYVGKAKSIRKRLANYFVRDLAPRTRAMVTAADNVEWIVTDNEVAALMLEFSLIKEHRPRFNIRLRDDKSFPYLAITRNQEWPRVSVMRGKRRKGCPVLRSVRTRNTQSGRPGTCCCGRSP